MDGVLPGEYQLLRGYLIKVVKNGITNKGIHPSLTLKGKKGKLLNRINHYVDEDIKDMLRRLNNYSDKDMILFANKGYPLFIMMKALLVFKCCFLERL